MFLFILVTVSDLPLCAILSTKGKDGPKREAHSVDEGWQTMGAG